MDSQPLAWGPSPSALDNVTYLSTLYDSGVLDDGPHNLSIVSASDNVPLWIYFVEIEATQQEMTFPTARLAHPPDLSPGTIVGIVLGCVLFLLVLSGGGWYIRRKHMQPRRESDLRKFDILLTDTGEQALLVRAQYEGVY